MTLTGVKSLARELRYLHEVYMSLHEKALLPRQATERHDQLLAGFTLLPTSGK
jgi:hypothetical protein